MSTNTSDETAESVPDETLLRERVRANPQPALRWAGVLAVLLLLELGRIAGWLTTVGTALEFVFDAVATLRRGSAVTSAMRRSHSSAISSVTH